MSIDRTKVTPMSIEEKGLGFGSLFGKHEPEGLAEDIFSRMQAVGTWVPIAEAKAEECDDADWLPDFVSAGLLVVADGAYHVTDLFIEVLDAQASRTPKQNFYHRRFEEMSEKLFARIGQEA